MGPEAEFFIFDEVSYFAGQHSAGYSVDSEEAPWNSGKPGLGHQIGLKGGYFPVSPYDATQDLRSVMVRTLMDAGIDIEIHHHEVGTAGQAEIDMRFGPLVKMADQIQAYKYIIKNVAKAHGKTVTFMPKPIFQDNGSGMHTHQSLWKDGKPLFAGEEYAGLSQMALWYTGGILKHINSLLAFSAPDYEFVPAPGTRLRSAGGGGLLGPQPLRGRAYPDLLGLAQGQAHRVPLPGPGGQPLSGLCSHGDGRHGRHQEPDRPGQSVGDWTSSTRIR